MSYNLHILIKNSYFVQNVFITFYTKRLKEKEELVLATELPHAFIEKQPNAMGTLLRFPVTRLMT